MFNRTEDVERTYLNEIVDKLEDAYQADVDRSILYFACTRAMHRLTLTHTGDLTSIIDS